MGEIYWGCYQYDEQRSLQCLSADCLTLPGDTHISHDGNWLVAGTAEHVYQDLISSSLHQNHPNSSFTWVYDVSTRASAIAELAVQSLDAGNKGGSADAVKPVYIRNQVTHAAKA